MVNVVAVISSGGKVEARPKGNSHRAIIKRPGTPTCMALLRVGVVTGYLI
jgi:hypothetical protein